MIPIRIKEIGLYTTKNGQTPFIEWLESLKDKTCRYRIKERLDRVVLGNMGDFKYISEVYQNFV